MGTLRVVLVSTILLLNVVQAGAQFYPGPPVPGVPVLVPNGLGFEYRGRRLSVSGFFNTGYSAGFIPAYPVGPGFPGPFGPGVPGGILPVVPIQTLPLTGYSDTRVTYQIITPTVVVGPRRGLGGTLEELDLSGVDLDASPSPLHKYERDRKGPPRVGTKPLLEPERPPVPPMLPREDVPLPPPKLEKPKLEKPMPPVEPPSFLDQGITAFRDSEFGLAALNFKQAVLAEPKSAKPHILLAHAYLAQGKLRDALAALEEGLKKDPDFPLRAFNPRTELFKGIDEEYVRQRKMLNELIREHPKHATYLFLHAYLDWFEGSREEARRTFTRLRPMTTEPWFVDRFLGS